MDNAELYQTSNSLQKRDAIQCLEEYAAKIKWKKNGDKIIDIGCGDGGVTDILKNYIPSEYGKLLGCDISEKMIHFANQHHGDDRTNFIVLDIEGKLPKSLQEKFDHAFSFYALHWIKDQETCFQNIYDLLNDNGDCLLLFLANMPLFDAYRTLARSNKWSSYLQDVDRFVSPYHDSQDPEKELKKLLDKIGFTNIEVKCECVEFTFTSANAWKRSLEAVNPFNIPRDQYQEFMNDLIEVIYDMRIVNLKNSNNVAVAFSYTTLIVNASKKENKCIH